MTIETKYNIGDKVWAIVDNEVQCNQIGGIKAQTDDKAVDWLKDNWREYIFHDADGMIGFIGWEKDFRKAMKKK